VLGANPTNPLVADTDGDGLLDGVEDANHNGVCDPGETNPNLKDTDGGGVDDGLELKAGTNPLLKSDDYWIRGSGCAAAAGTVPSLFSGLALALLWLKLRRRTRPLAQTPPETSAS
jgi:large repetitive protein